MPRSAGSRRAGGKKLIEFGWDEPDTAFMRRHIAQMETTPFDGCVFHITYTTSEGKSANFIWECWTSGRLPKRNCAPRWRS